MRMGDPVMKKLCLGALAVVALACNAFSADTEVDRLNAATAVLKAMTHMDDKGVPMDLIEKSTCIVVVPNLKKGGFIVGAKYGRGFLACRKASGVNWTNPAAIRIEGGSFGFLIGGTETDVILLVMNKEGATKLLESTFTLGGDATVAAGPVGRNTSAQTDAKLTAGILSYSRARGAFAGVAIEGGTLRQDEDDNKALYGSPLTTKQVLTGTVKTPAAARPFIATLDGISRTKKK